MFFSNIRLYHTAFKVRLITTVTNSLKSVIHMNKGPTCFIKVLYKTVVDFVMYGV